MFEEPKKETANMKFIRTGDYKYKTEKITEKELEEARENSKKFEWMDLGRSCWECNSAHVHHLGEIGGDGKNQENYNCFSCGRYYHNNIDITDYEGSEIEESAKNNLLTNSPE